MSFNLAKAIIMSDERQGKEFKGSPELLAMVNARIDRLLQEQRRRVAAGTGEEV